MPASDILQRPLVESGRPKLADWMFIVFLVCMLIVIGVLGRMTFREGLRTEASKSQAEALLQWLGQASTQRFAEGYVLPACSGHASVGSSTTSWGECAKALVRASGPLESVRNSFTDQPIGLITRCEAGDLSTAGQIVIEKITPTPPGSAVALTIGPIEVDEPLGRKLTFRLTVCDKGGYPIRVGETTF